MELDISIYRAPWPQRRPTTRPYVESVESNQSHCNRFSLKECRAYILSHYCTYHKVSYSLQELQPCVDHGLFHGLWRLCESSFVALRPTPNLEDQGLRIFWPDPLICLVCVALSGVYASASIAFRVVGASKVHPHCKVAVLAEVKKKMFTCFKSIPKLGWILHV
jgi:hypothetical protein